MHCRSEFSNTPAKLYINERKITNLLCYFPLISKLNSKKKFRNWIKIGQNLPSVPPSSIKNYLNNRVSNSTFLNPITEISTIINDLNTNKGYGYDKIFYFFVKLSSSIIITPFLLDFWTHFWNKVFFWSVESSQNCHIFKKGTKFDINYY